MTDLSPWVSKYIERLFAYVAAGNTEPTDEFNVAECEWRAREHLAAQPELAQRVRDVGLRLGMPIPAQVFEDVALISAYVDNHHELPRRIDEQHCNWLIRVHFEPRSRPDLAAIARAAADRLRAARLLGARPAVAQCAVG